MAWRAAQGLHLVAEAYRAPPRDPEFYTLLAANLGTSVIPWALLYQQSATVHKGSGPPICWRRGSRRWSASSFAR